MGRKQPSTSSGVFFWQSTPTMFSRLALAALPLASSKVYFSETFGDGWESRWTSSEWKKSEGTQGEFVSATGKWFGDENCSNRNGCGTYNDTYNGGDDDMNAGSGPRQRNIAIDSCCSYASKIVL